MPRAELSDSARCVIIGGGVGGTSLAYHLAELGWEDVILLDRAELTSGSTFHSAGLVGQLRGSVSLTKMMMPTANLPSSCLLTTFVLFALIFPLRRLNTSEPSRR